MTREERLAHLPHLASVAQRDLVQIRRKEEGTPENPGYEGAWREDGDRAAWFELLGRKITRLRRQAEAHNHDVFAAMLADTDGTGIRDTIRDLRTGLLILEAEYDRRHDDHV